MPTFDMVVVGCGGGPSETNLSAYLLKACGRSWEEGIIGLEAGSGLGALTLLLKQNPALFDTSQSPNHMPTSCYSASDIYSFLRCYLVSHAHLDHVNGLVLSAGSQRGPRKRVYGSQYTLDNLQTIFSDRVWPNLASWDEKDPAFMLLYSYLDDSGFTNIGTDISVRTMPVSHGQNATTGTYNSSTFFIRHDPTAREFLFFGDVEPDSVAAYPQTAHVWRAAAPKIPDTLSTIFIECSWPSGRADATLFGHLTPEHLADELAVLAAEVVLARRAPAARPTTRSSATGRVEREPLRKKKRSNPLAPDALHGALDGVRVCIMHCKDDTEGKFDRPIHRVIADQVRKLVEERKLGAEVLSVEQGMHITI